MLLGHFICIACIYMLCCTAKLRVVCNSKEGHQFCRTADCFADDSLDNKCIENKHGSKMFSTLGLAGLSLPECLRFPKAF